ncbi:conserved hypothetical protein [Ricinus communis]|uniref:Uncharacterized protein n=1 Tax=Ricinus communis TaxID=3988 RepID=B9TJY9_RICCO|nr:conserved hypothetical protein [Ricinus communis]
MSVSRPKRQGTYLIRSQNSKASKRTSLWRASGRAVARATAREAAGACGHQEMDDAETRDPVGKV